MKKGFLIVLVVMLFSCFALTAWADDTVTLSGKVSLPEGEVCEEEIDVNVVARKVGNNVLADIALNVYESKGVIPVGETSTEYSIDLPQGNYVLTLYTYGRAGETLLGEFYYNSEKLSSHYGLQQIVEVPGNTRLNMTLPKATNTISGTLTFETPALEDSYINFSTYTEFNTIHYDCSYNQVVYYVEAGTKKLDYVIPVAEGSTTVDVDYNRVTYRIKNDNTLDTYWNNDRFFDTTTSHQNVNITMKSVEEDDGAVEDLMSITINLPDPVEDWTSYFVNLYSCESGWWINDCHIQLKPGEQTKTVTLDKAYESFHIELRDENAGTIVYVGGEYGTTNEWTERTIFDAETEEVVVNFPETIAVTGTVKRNSAFLNNSFDVELSLELNNGNTYTGAAKFAADSSDGVFTVNVPFYNKDVTGVIYYTAGDNRGEHVAVTVGQQEAIELELPEGFTTKYNISINLSEVAPSGGVGVTLDYYGVGNKYYIPAGQTTLSTVAEFYSSSEDRINVYCSVTSEDLEFVKSMNTSIGKDTTSVIGINKRELVKVSGTVTVPPYVSLNGITLSMYLGTYEDGYYSYISIPKGKTTGEYAFYVAKGESLNVLYASPEDASGGTYYYEHNGDKYYEAIALNEDFVANINGKDFDKMLVDSIESGDIKIDWITSTFFSDGGGLYSQFSCENNTTSNYNPVMILAVYDEFGNFVETQVNTDLTIYANSNRGCSLYFYTEINPDYTYKTMLVNNTYYLTPLLESITAN